MKDFRPAAGKPWLFAVLVVAVGLSAQTPTPEPAYVVRGHAAEIRQSALKERLDRFHDDLSTQLRRDAPDLLAKIEPPPPIAYGYQLLPRVLTDKPPAPAPKPQVARFSWSWCETLISRENASLERLESDLAAASKKPPAERHAAYESIVDDYTKALDHRRVIDADVDYNWLWQRQIANDRPLFDRLNTRLNTAQADLARTPPSGRKTADQATGYALDLEPPNFVRVDVPAPHVHVVAVPFYTDIVDAAWVESFEHAIEGYWHVHSGEEEYRVRIVITPISPEKLYCSTNAADAEENRAAKCAPPAKGTHINLAAHVARFPAGAAVLTTGAESLQVVAGRAIVVASHDVAPRTLAHEFGHILGFPDAYLRGYKDLGVDGFEILELVPDYTDIMSSPGFGSVLPQHFAALIAAKRVEELMLAGLDALYKQSDPATAAAKFREILSINPDHYGATLQLAKALDRAGKPSEALPLWRKMEGMAESAGDKETLQTVRARLASTPP